MFVVGALCISVDLVVDEVSVVVFDVTAIDVVDDVVDVIVVLVGVVEVLTLEVDLDAKAVREVE